MFSSCSSDTKKRKMETANTIEMVLFQTNEGISTEQGKEAMKGLAEFISIQPGFVARKTSIAEDGQFLDLVFWTDLASAKAASERAMKNEALLKHFSVIDEKGMTFKHFEVFHALDK